jgi:NAD(P)-dependent dehydrogenase (short-subunit alcohol dehydrogenase family)
MDLMPFQRILITGASSGIGRALAVLLAQPGTTLYLGGRDHERLRATAAGCRIRGAEVATRVLSVTDRMGMANWIYASGPLDLVIANAGISGGTGEGGEESGEQTRAIFETNLDGVLNTVLPSIGLMMSQPPAVGGIRGRIAVVASVAAFLPGPLAPAYCASKAAVDSWVVGTAPTAKRHGILLTSLCPGFVASPMTEVNKFPMPGIMSAEKAAIRIMRAIERGAVRGAFPGWIAWGARLAALLPPALRTTLLDRFPAKQGLD